MPAITATGPACQAMLAALRADVTLTAIVPASRILDEMPSSSQAVYPLILVESHGEQPFNTLGAPAVPAFGSSAMLAVRVLSQYRGDAEVNSLTSRVRGVLDGLAITIAPHRPGLLTFEGLAPMMKTAIGGITTREQISEFDLEMHQ